MEYNYVDCSNFVKHKLGITLFAYQEQMLKAFCEGKRVRCSRCVGRTYVAQAFGKYVASLYDKNNYNETPDVVFLYECAVDAGLIDKSLIDRERENLSAEVFRREYECV